MSAPCTALPAVGLACWKPVLHTPTPSFQRLGEALLRRVPRDSSVGTVSVISHVASNRGPVPEVHAGVRFLAASHALKEIRDVVYALRRSYLLAGVLNVSVKWRKSVTFFGSDPYWARTARTT